MSTIDIGLSPDEALRRVPDFLGVLREGKISPADARLDDASIDVLHAACRLLAEPSAGGVENPLDSVRALYDFIEKVIWLGPDFDERAELLAACAFAGWRIARPLATPPITDQWQSRLFAATPDMLPLRNGTSADNPARNQFEINPQTKTEPIPPLRAFRRRRLSPEEGNVAALHVLTVPIDQTPEILHELKLDDPETLLPLLDQLRQQLECSPGRVLEETSFLYSYLNKLQPQYPIDSFLLDEREYFLGETARIAGTACRELSRREEARRWLDLSEAWFLSTENASGNLAKVAYQRLALRTEEREFEAVSELLPRLIDTLQKLGMAEDAIKARFLEAAVLKETDNLAQAMAVLEEIASEAQELKNKGLLAWAYVNMVQIHGILGELDRAVQRSRTVTPLLRDLGNHVGLAKLQWGVGYLLRSQRQFPAAIDAFRTAQTEFAEIGMRADVAAVHLIVADILLDASQEKQAEWEIRQALPLIDEYKLVPEGFAAMTLLRESLRRQKIDRQALRNLHEHFEQKKP